MVDNLSREARSRHMGGVRQADTGAELAVRSLAHRLGYRFRVGRKDLPGRPDIVFPLRRAVIFVHGCFWHRHEDCRRTTTPKTNAEFWEAKFAANKSRDAAVERKLTDAGWRVMVVWECEVRDEAGLAAKLTGFLGAPGAGHRSSGSEQ